MIKKYHLIWKNSNKNKSKVKRKTIMSDNIDFKKDYNGFLKKVPYQTPVVEYKNAKYLNDKKSK